ncbi:MAG TPA: putative quinol monooxygenase [Acidisarcina sp.]|nr:putative quinol monooxygenase [Acidisarcina sp.]
MVTFTVRMRFAGEDRQQVVEILKNLATLSRQEPGCVNYIPHFIEDDPDTILIYEQYRDKEALEAHRASPHFQKYAIAGLYQLMRERASENLTAVA